MKKTIYILIAISLLSFCQNKSIAQISKTGKIVIDKETGVKKGIIPDYFKISKADFSKFKSDNSKWFISSDGKNRLYFVPYTDYSITTAILTNQPMEDSELINLLQFEGIQYNETTKSIRLKEIKSELGIRIGISEDEVSKIIGEPDLIKGNNKTWDFNMLEDKSNQKIGGLKPFVIEGLEFTVNITFTDGKLTKVIYQYEVP